VKTHLQHILRAPRVKANGVGILGVALQAEMQVKILKNGEVMALTPAGLRIELWQEGGTSGLLLKGERPQSRRAVTTAMRGDQRIFNVTLMSSLGIPAGGVREGKKG